MSIRTTKASVEKTEAYLYQLPKSLIKISG